MISSLGTRYLTAFPPAQSSQLRQDSSPGRSDLKVSKAERVIDSRSWLQVVKFDQVARDEITALLLTFSSTCKMTTTNFIRLSPITFLSEVSSPTSSVYFIKLSLKTYLAENDFFQRPTSVVVAYCSYTARCSRDS